jgi:hypothetical protein
LYCSFKKEGFRQHKLHYSAKLVALIYPVTAGADLKTQHVAMGDLRGNEEVSERRGKKPSELQQAPQVENKKRSNRLAMNEQR